MTFNELNLSAPLLRAVAEAGYESPSPIQASAIPPVLAGRDLMGCAQTGTGKTAAFALPMLDRLTAAPAKKKGAVRALILTPTRELALQIGESFELYGKYLNQRSTVIFGGVGQAPQVAALKKGVDILIACPGRLNDLVGQGLIDLSHIEIFVLDEADRMLDMGFIHDVKKILKWLPAKKQTMLFSATMPPEIAALVNSLLHDPARVAVWKDVQDSPTFLEFWPQMASFLQGVTHLVAHNAPFDRRVLEACCQSNGIALPDLPFVCTLRESRRKLKLPSHKLDAVCRYCGIPLDHHHAGSDAIAAARILIYLQGESQGGE